MATYTNRIGLLKQADGENPNSWGTKLNENVIDLVDEAVAGYEAISLDGVSTSVVLTDTDGVSNQARNAGLRFTGELAGNVSVTLPAQEKIYYIANDTTGSYNILVGPVGGQYVTVAPQNQTMMLATDGTSTSKLEQATSVSFASSASYAASTSYAASAGGLTDGVNITVGTVSATSIFGGTLRLNSSISANTVYVSSALVVGVTTTDSSFSTFYGLADFKDGIRVSGSNGLQTSGNVSVGGNIFVNGKLSVTGVISAGNFYGNTITGNNIISKGYVSAVGTVKGDTIYGITKVSTPLVDTSAIYFRTSANDNDYFYIASEKLTSKNKLGIYAESSVSGWRKVLEITNDGVKVSGSLSVSDEVQFYKGAYVSGTVSILGDVSIRNGNIAVSGTGSFYSPVFVSGSLSISGNLIEINKAYAGGGPDEGITIRANTSSAEYFVIANASGNTLVSSAGSVFINAGQESGSSSFQVYAPQAYVSTDSRIGLYAVSSTNFRRSDSFGHVANFTYVCGTTLYNVAHVSINDSSGAFESTSDYRLKENISAITSAAERIKALNAVRFNFKSMPDNTIDGFIAHEVQQTSFNYLVGGEKDATAQIEILNENTQEYETTTVPNYQTLNYAGFVPILVASMKEAINRIEELESKVSALENS